MGVQNFIRQRIGDIFGKVGERGRDDVTQLTARDAGDFLVDRNVPADVERIRFVAFIEKLELRIEEDKLGLIAIEIDAAEENDFAAGAVR